MKVKYENHNFKQPALDIIESAEAICLEYQSQGFALTLRQLYYQFVARGLLANNDKNYNRLGKTISDARKAGMFDWDFIVDRTRNLVDRTHWDSPQKLIERAAEGFLMDTWAAQKKRIEVWIEKDAAIGVIEYVCHENDVPYFSCRGYVSTSEMYVAGTRIGENLRNGEQTLILHIGDHDPSGLHMSKNIEERLRTFIHQDWVNEFGWGALSSSERTRGTLRQSMREHMREQGSTIGDDELPWAVERIALTVEQIEEYGPPPNYAKESDSRYREYVAETGLTDSWELDALDPAVMVDLVQDKIDAFRDDEAYGKAQAKQERERAVLVAVKDNWETIKRVHGGGDASSTSDEGGA